MDIESARPGITVQDDELQWKESKIGSDPNDIDLNEDTHKINRSKSSKKTPLIE